MKELSLEEKARAYDIVLDKIKMLLGTGSSISREELKYVFHELKESEDEMIRKDLLYWLYSYKDGNETFVPAEDVDVWITYLEKQGEKSIVKSYEWDNEKKYCYPSCVISKQESEDEKIRKRIIQALHGDVLDIDEISKYIAWLEKQGKKKPINETPYPETLEKAIDLYYYSYGNGKGEFEHLSLEKFRDIVHTFVSDYSQKSDASETMNEKGDFDNGFTRMMEKEQKPAWSEEDETMITDLSVIVHTYFSEINGIPFKYDLSEDKIRTWLKSLRPQNTWKPADGDDLPEIDREVIVLINYNAQRNIHDEEYPTYRVGFGHRPNPNRWDGKNIDTNEVTHYTPKLYDKGGWNAPDIAYWLDVELPKEIEL